MSTKENSPIPEENNPIPQSKDQGKTTSDRKHIDPLQKKAHDTPNTGGKSGK